MRGLVPLPDVLAKYQIARQSLYRWMAEGFFPRPVKLKPGRTCRIYFRRKDLAAFDRRALSGPSLPALAVAARRAQVGAGKKRKKRT